MFIYEQYIDCANPSSYFEDGLADNFRTMDMLYRDDEIIDFILMYCAL